MASEDTSHECGYCKQTRSVPQFDTTDILGHNWKVNQCHNCNAFFLAPPPTPEQLAEAYDPTYYGEGEDKFDASTEKVLDYFRKKRAKLIAKYAGEGGNVLDIGCGNGRVLQFVKERANVEIHGVEMEGGSANRAQQVPGMNLKVGTLAESDFTAESLDVVSMFHVFEHLTEPAETLATVTKILKPGGTLIMSFPNIDSNQARFFKGDWLHLDPPRHLFFFSPADFKRTLREFGFGVVAENHFTFEYNPYGMTQSLLNRWIGKREVLYEAKKGNTAYVQEYSKLNLTLQNLFFMASMPLFVGLDAIDAVMKRGATVEFVLQKKRA